MELSRFSTLRKLPQVAAMLVWAFAVMAVLPHSASANSVSTTDVNDSVVHQNLYDAKTDVYISGKPTTCGGEGLSPDGTYYFQVTNPSGSVLLSSDPLNCRQITVSGGVITAYSPSGLGCPARNIGTPIVDCLDGKVTVQLAPFDDTPNNGGVYKAWVEPTIVGLPAGCDPTAAEGQDGWAACANFDRSSSKTDNFKIKSGVTPPPSLQSEVDIFKFCDVNGNGVLDNDELNFPLDGWTMNVTQGLTNFCTGTTGTDGLGLKVCSPLDPGTYDVAEVPQSGFNHTATCFGGGCGLCDVSATPCNVDAECPLFPGNPADTCSLFNDLNPVSLTLAAGQTSEVDFGNVGGITGHKFSDLNGNGSDDGEPGVQGVQFKLTGTALDGQTPISLCTNTDANGNYSFPLTPGTNLTVTEVPPPNSIQTLNPTCTGSFGDPTNPASCGGFNCTFGNACLSGSCAAKTMGWWKNSGNSSITKDDLCALTALNLRNGAGGSFDPLTAALCTGSPTTTQIANGRKALATWLGNATATNMAYMLSAQLATMVLNTRHPSANCNLTGVSLYVGTPPTTSPSCLGKGTGNALVNANGFITLSALITDANAELGSYPITTSGKTDAVCQTFKKTALDKANNSETVGGPGIINVTCPTVNAPCPTP